MRRTLLSRALASWTAICLALVLGESPLVHHHCPMHDGSMPASAMAGHASHHDAGSPAGEHGKHLCTCVGACSAASATVALTAPRPETAHFDESRRATSRRTLVPPAPTRAAFARPFANGPPRSLVA